MTHRFLRLGTARKKDVVDEADEARLLETFVAEALRVCGEAVRLRFKHQCPGADHVNGILLHPIVDILWDTYRLSRMIREEITWTEYWPCRPTYRDPYNPTQMVAATESDGLGNLKKASAGVVCALRLGLAFRTYKPRNAEGVAVRAQVLLSNRVNPLFPKGCNFHTYGPGSDLIEIRRHADAPSSHLS